MPQSGCMIVPRVLAMGALALASHGAAGQSILALARASRSTRCRADPPSRCVWAASRTRAYSCRRRPADRPSRAPVKAALIRARR